MKILTFKNLAAFRTNIYIMFVFMGLFFVQCDTNNSIDSDNYIEVISFTDTKTNTELIELGVIHKDSWMRDYSNLSIVNDSDIIINSRELTVLVDKELENAVQVKSSLRYSLKNFNFAQYVEYKKERINSGVAESDPLVSKAIILTEKVASNGTTSIDTMLVLKSERLSENRYAIWQIVDIQDDDTGLRILTMYIVYDLIKSSSGTKLLSNQFFTNYKIFQVHNFQQNSPEYTFEQPNKMFESGYIDKFLGIIKNKYAIVASGGRLVSVNMETNKADIIATSLLFSRNISSPKIKNNFLYIVDGNTILKYNPVTKEQNFVLEHSEFSISEHILSFSANGEYLYICYISDENLSYSQNRVVVQEFNLKTNSSRYIYNKTYSNSAPVISNVIELDNRKIALVSRYATFN